jgi:hypothetical protein
MDIKKIFFLTCAFGYININHMPLNAAEWQGLPTQPVIEKPGILISEPAQAKIARFPGHSTQPTFDVAGFLLNDPCTNLNTVFSLIEHNPQDRWWLMRGVNNFTRSMSQEEKAKLFRNALQMPSVTDETRSNYQDFFGYMGFGSFCCLCHSRFKISKCCSADNRGTGIADELYKLAENVNQRTEFDVELTSVQSFYQSLIDAANPGFVGMVSGKDQRFLDNLATVFYLEQHELNQKKHASSYSESLKTQRTKIASVLGGLQDYAQKILANL